MLLPHRSRPLLPGLRGVRVPEHDLVEIDRLGLRAPVAIDAKVGAQTPRYAGSIASAGAEINIITAIRRFLTMTTITELPIQPSASDQVYIEILLGFIEAARHGNMTRLEINAVIDGEKRRAYLAAKL